MNENSVGNAHTTVVAGHHHSLILEASGRIMVKGGRPHDLLAANDQYVAVAAGGSRNFALRVDGTIMYWGGETFSQCGMPSPDSAFVALAAGEFHGLALARDGSIVAWGGNDAGQCTVPANPKRRYVAIAAGDEHSIALRSDGTVRAWGKRSNGRCSVPKPNQGLVAIAGGGSHSLALRDSGAVVSWGHNKYGQCDVPVPNFGFVAIAAGADHSLGLRADGSVVAWGANEHGQCDVPAPNEDFLAIAAGDEHSIGVKSDGSIVAWGSDDNRQCSAASRSLQGDRSVAARAAVRSPIGGSQFTSLRIPSIMQQRFCVRCGAELIDGANYCGACGRQHLSPPSTASDGGPPHATATRTGTVDEVFVQCPHCRETIRPGAETCPFCRNTVYTSGVGNMLLRWAIGAVSCGILYWAITAWTGWGLMSDKTITAEQYGAIYRGMYKAQVLEVLGDPEGGADSGVWLYHIDHGKYSDLVTVMFNENGQVWEILKQ